MNKLMEWKERLKKGNMFSIICVLLIVVAVLGVILYKKQKEYSEMNILFSFWKYLKQKKK